LFTERVEAPGVLSCKIAHIAPAYPAGLHSICTRTDGPGTEGTGILFTEMDLRLSRMTARDVSVDDYLILSNRFDTLQ
jgi:hypothetical protein